MKYTKEQFLKAAELGEVSMIDARHIVSLLDEVVELSQQNTDVREEILCAAIWYKDIPIKKDISDNVRPINCDRGLVFCGYRHCNCMYTMVSVTGLRSVETEVGEYIQGFLTNKNRFVDRIEGGIIHRANGNTTDFDDLYSEDLYTISQVPQQNDDVIELVELVIKSSNTNPYKGKLSKEDNIKAAIDLAKLAKEFADKGQTLEAMNVSSEQWKKVINELYYMKFDDVGEDDVGYSLINNKKLKKAIETFKSLRDNSELELLWQRYDSKMQVLESLLNELIPLENTYTEEQVREAVKMAQTRKYNSHFHNADEIIQSLKQPKL